MSNKIIVPFLLVLLMGCNSGGGDGEPATPSIQSASEAVEALETSGEIPDLDFSEELSGTDSDENGIRDDIDLYIDDENITESQKDNIRDLAKGLQSVMTSDLTDETAIDELQEKIGVTVRCLARVFSNPATGYTYLKKMEGYTANTQDRAEKYDEYNALLDGSVSRLSSIDCE